MIDTDPKVKEALTEATAVHSLARQISEMLGVGREEPSREMLESASEFLDALMVEDPGKADLMIDTANKWKQIETSVTPEDLSVLLEASRSIPQQEGGRDFLQNLPKHIHIDDSNLIIDQLENIFSHNQELTRVLSSTPELRALWYGHLYLILKSAIIVATA